MNSLRRDLRACSLPSGETPDLDPVAEPNYRYFLARPYIRVQAQTERQSDTASRSRGTLGSRRDEEPLDCGRRDGSVHEHLPLAVTEEPQTAFGTFRKHHGTGNAAPKSRGKADPVLVINAVYVAAAKHIHPTPCHAQPLCASTLYPIPLRFLTSHQLMVRPIDERV